MMKRDYTDITGGCLLLICGISFSWYAAANYNLGTLRSMGPGMFPVALGIILALFGAVVVLPAFFRGGSRPNIRIWSPLFVLAGVAAFALTLEPLGLIPAIWAVTIISSLAELKVNPLQIGLLCLLLSTIAWLTFSVGLGLPLAMFQWNF